MGCGSGVGKKVHMSNCSRVSLTFVSACLGCLGCETCHEKGSVSEPAGR